MKIVAGLGSIDDYARLAEAGADEVFCGFVPYEWNKRYGTLFPLNRREVLYYNIQINSYEDMKILKKMIAKYKVPVTIAFNYLYYLDEQYPIIADIINNLKDIGFNEFIIGDIALLQYLKENKIDGIYHLSGECAEINSLSMEFLNQFQIARYIFHRKNTIEDMKSCISEHKYKVKQYEAFVLNERCHYTGGFCSSLHCDELTHLCKIPYELSKIDNQLNTFKLVDIQLKKYNDELEKFYENEINEENEIEDTYVLGNTGCGICALSKLKDAGVTHLKVVGRGNSIDNMERDIKNLKMALAILKNNQLSYEKEVKGKLFKGKCSGECYYNMDEK